MKTYDRKINYYETDQMGVVHHSNYIRFFEESRISFMDQVGYPYARLEDEGIISPVTGVSCKYLKPVKFGDTIRIAVSLVKLSRVKFTFNYEVTDFSTGELRARGSSEHAFINRDGKPLIIAREKPEFYEAFANELEKEGE